MQYTKEYTTKKLKRRKKGNERKENEKNLKLIVMLFVMIGVIASSLTSVKAHSVDLDPDSLITFPMWVINGEGQITVDDSITEYTLYYQAVEISNTNYEQIEEINTTAEAELEAINTEIETLRTERDNLKTIYDEAEEAYVEANLAGVTGTELEELQAALDTAEANYQNKLDEYVEKQNEYSTTLNTANDRINELTPSYVEENWIETEDGNFVVDTSQFSGDKAYAVWVKLVDANEITTYDEGTYTMSGTRVENIEVEGITLDRTTLTIKEGSSYTLHATITPEDATDKSIIWESDNENVATVSDGIVTARSTGTATITATTSDGEFVATCEVTVTEGSNTGTNGNNDPTVSNVKLPYAGINALIVIGILAMITISIISYKIYARYKDVK